MRRLSSLPRFNPRSGKVNFIGVVMVILLVVGGVWCYTFLPFYWHHRKMNEIVKSAALYWKDLGIDRGKRQLKERLYSDEIPPYISESDCQFNEGHGKTRTVTCEWTVEEKWPVVGHTKRMSFVSESTIHADGVVE